jgi:hypothetical protein
MKYIGRDAGISKLPKNESSQGHSARPTSCQLLTGSPTCPMDGRQVQRAF